MGNCERPVGPFPAFIANAALRAPVSDSRELSGHFTHLLKIAKRFPSPQPPYCAWTLGPLPGPSFSICCCFSLSLSQSASGPLFRRLPQGTFQGFPSTIPIVPTSHALLFFFFFEDNFFMVLCRFLLYNEVNQGNTCTPSLLIHISPHPSGSSQSPEPGSLYYTAASH